MKTAVVSSNPLLTASFSDWKQEYPDLPSWSNWVTERIADQPASRYCHAFSRCVEENDITIVQGPTGCGKSTVLPPLEVLEGRRVVTLVPRRLIASSLLDRVSELLGTEPGTLVGVRTAVENRTSGLDTRLTYCTDGYYLAALLAGDPLPADALVLDEIHEWNKNTELVKAIWHYDAEFRARTPKLIMMSATFDVEAMQASLGKVAPGCSVGVLQIPEEESLYGYTLEEKKKGSVTGEIKRFVQEGEDVLVVLPGKSEIYETKALLEGMPDVDAEIIPLHRGLSMTDQRRVFHEYGRPKVILATNIVESGITLPNVCRLVTTGRKRIAKLKHGIEILELTECTRFNIDQQIGRIRRMGEGIAVLLSDLSYKDRPQDDLAEIERTRLELDILRGLIARGHYDLRKLPLVHKPGNENVESALKNLNLHHCIKDARSTNTYATKHGKKCAFLPAQFEFGILIKEARKRGIEDLAILCAAVVQVGGMALGYKDDEDELWRNHCRNETRMDPLAHVHLFLRAHEERASVDEEFETAGVGQPGLTRNKAKERDDEFEKRMKSLGLDAVKYKDTLESIDMLTKGSDTFSIPGEITSQMRDNLLNCFIIAYQAHPYIQIADGSLESANEDFMPRRLSHDSNVSTDDIRDPIILGIPFTLKNGKPIDLVKMAVVAPRESVIGLLPDIELPKLVLSEMPSRTRGRGMNGKGNGNGKNSHKR